MSARIPRRLLFEVFLVLINVAGTRSLSFNPVPTITASTRQVANLQDDNKFQAATVGLYVHIPFCRRRCRYCDFAIVPIGNNILPTSFVPADSSSQQRQENVLFESYQTAIVQEIQSIGSFESEYNHIKKIVLDTIYFGGGTPSLAPLSMLQAIVNAIRDTFYLADNLEFTMECDPGK